MGRPPIGRHAMSGAERQRRYMEKLTQGQPDSDLNAELTEARARIAKLERDLDAAHERIRELEAGRPKPGAGSSASVSNNDPKVRARLDELMQEVRRLRDREQRIEVDHKDGNVVSVYAMVERLVPLFERVKEQSTRHVALRSNAELILIASEGRRILDGWADGDDSVRRVRGHAAPAKPRRK